MNPYEAKQAARKARLHAAADRADERAAQAYKRSDMSEAATGIPFGQPILIGHHSERRHRAAIKKSDAAMRRSVDETKKAERLRGKAASVGNGGISSDDPDAISKLKAQLEEREKQQAFMKNVNAAVRKKDDDALRALGLKENQIVAIKEPDFAGRAGFPGYQLSNNNAQIKRIRQRIASLEKNAQAESKEVQHDGFRVVENVDDNRIQLIFDGKPSSAVRDILKSEAFRWSPHAEAWQRQLTNAGRYAAKQAVKKIAEI